MKQKLLTFLSSIILINSAYAGSITTSPLIGHSDEITSVFIKKESESKYLVLAKTHLETFSLVMQSYANASALAADLKKNSILHCKLKTPIRAETISQCSFVEIKFGD